MMNLVIHTIGHSNHTTEAFVDLLRRHGITLVVDVRSQPYKRWLRQAAIYRVLLPLTMKGVGGF